MRRTMLGGKIHRATVTAADLEYVGSITIDRDLMTASGILEHEKVQVVDVTNGSRLETYAIPGPSGSGTIQLNGAAARLMSVGDVIIIMSFVELEDEEARSWKPSVVLVDEANRPVTVTRGVQGGIYKPVPA